VSKSSGRRRERLFVLNDPHALRVSAALAVEIGLAESMILLQLEFLISISDNVHDGRVWTYQSLNDLRVSYFPFWSKATIGRAVRSLVERDLLIVGNFNRAGFDRTPWYALNPEGLARLTSLRYESPTSQIETTSSHPAPSMFHAATSTAQSGPTIPETTSDTTSEKNGRTGENDTDPTPTWTIPDPRTMTLEERITWTEERERTRKAIARAERTMLGGS
jgi:hypothetical protein